MRREKGEYALEAAFVLKQTAYETGCKNYLLRRSAASCILVPEQTKGSIEMDMHDGTHFHAIADHHDDIVSFERASAARKAETPVVTPAACGEGWYHDAAIADAEKDAVEARSNPYHH